MNPDVDPNIVGAERHLHKRPSIRPTRIIQKTAAVMKLVIDGNAAAGTIEMGGFDYHTGNRMRRRGARFQPRQLHRRRAWNMRRASASPS